MCGAVGLEKTEEIDLADGAPRSRGRKPDLNGRGMEVSTTRRVTNELTTLVGWLSLKCGPSGPGAKRSGLAVVLIRAPQMGRTLFSQVEWA